MLGYVSILVSIQSVFEMVGICLLENEPGARSTTRGCLILLVLYEDHETLCDNWMAY